MTDRPKATAFYGGYTFAYSTLEELREQMLARGFSLEEVEGVMRTVQVVNEQAIASRRRRDDDRD